MFGKFRLLNAAGSAMWCIRCETGKYKHEGDNDGASCKYHDPTTPSEPSAAASCPDDNTKGLNEGQAAWEYDSEQCQAKTNQTICVLYLIIWLWTFSRNIDTFSYFLCAIIFKNNKVTDDE